MQKTSCQSSTGWLALVATPIGNLEDITLRALRFLKEADVIAAEDTRRTRKLLSHYSITTPATSFHAYNEHAKTDSLIARVQQGERVAVVSDAGTPALADPGFLIVRTALQHGIEPEIVPGASALLFALTSAGLPVDRFYFAGYPPVKSGRRRKFMESLKRHDCTVFLYESPHKMARLLTEMNDILSPDTPVTIIREATKMHEERIRGTVKSLAEELQKHSWKGELTIALDLRGVT